ncbi:MAG: hypothetical protein KKG75_05115 [Nanoarchaeota archaeon]|nr:hypothetical protein [Nanoarchaeota archaeon]
MRGQGEYIIDKRLKFKKDLQKEFIATIKEHSKKTWNELAKILNIHPHTIQIDWYTEKRTIPLKKAKKLFLIYPFKDWDFLLKDWVEKELPPKWGQIKGGGKNKKQIKIPPSNTNLAEFLGCALGDGHLDKKEFTLSCDSTQKDYTLYIKKLIRELFDLDSKIFLNPCNKNNTLLDVYSVELIKILQKNGLKIGNKIKNKASLPNWVFKDIPSSCAALRGLFDTDGGIYEKQKGYNRAIIEFQTKSPYIAKNILKLLNILGFHASKGNKGLNIRIQDQKEVHYFFKIVGSSNIKNIIRYKRFLSEGIVPKRDKVIELMESYANCQNLPFKTK